jgi:glycosyl transferase family 87
LYVYYADLNKWAVGAFILLYAPLADHFAYAQTQILILLILVLVMRCLEQGKDALAGLLLALAGALRVFPLILVMYLIVRQRWRALIFTAMGLAIAGIVTLRVVGSEMTESFVVGTVFNVGRLGTAEPINVSLSAFVIRLFWYSFGLALSPALNGVRLVAVVCADLMVVVLAIKATSRTIRGRDLDSRTFSLWVVVCMMLSPIAWIHYMVLLLLPFVKIADAANQGRCGPRAAWAMVASYFLIALSIELRAPADAIGGPPLFVVVSEGAFVSLLLAFIAAYWFASDWPRAVASDASPVSNAPAL